MNVVLPEPDLPVIKRSDKLFPPLHIKNPSRFLSIVQESGIDKNKLGQERLFEFKVASFFANKKRGWYKTYHFPFRRFVFY